MVVRCERYVSGVSYPVQNDAGSHNATERTSLP
jgi:hypothetical protein